MAVIETLLADLRKKLVDTGTRTRLIHVNRHAKNAKSLDITGERSDDIYDLLLTQGKKMRFAGRGKDVDLDSEDGPLLEAVVSQEVDESRFTDTILDTSLTTDALQKRLLKLARDAKSAEEERGISILFLAMGFLQWYEAEASEVLREAPLILLPVQLVRNRRTSTYDLTCRDEDLVTNAALVERMKEMGILIPELKPTEKWTPSHYFEQVHDAISSKDRWDIDCDGMQLGPFSFAKFLMRQDLDPAKWEGTGSSLLDNELIAGLLMEQAETEVDSGIGDGAGDDTPTTLDLLPLDNLLHVVDADASQTQVIEDVRAGKNLVVQGPPGTGKSQTITNILAAAAHQGKTVLFVAEKMAALEVVHRRMEKANLHDLCLELHSTKTNKLNFYQELARTIANGRDAQLTPSTTSTLEATRERLNQATTLLHSLIEKRDYSPYSALAELVKLVGKDVLGTSMEDAAALESLPQVQLQTLFATLEKYLDWIRQHGLPSQHPLAGVGVTGLQPTALRRLERDIQQLRQMLEEWIGVQQAAERLVTDTPVLTLGFARAISALYRHIQKPHSKTATYLSLAFETRDSAALHHALAAAVEWVEYKAALDVNVKSFVWDTRVEGLRPHLVKGTGSWISRMVGGYRSASRELASYLNSELPKDPQARLQILDQIMEGREKKAAFDDVTPVLKEALGSLWQKERTPFKEIFEVVGWLGVVDWQIWKFSQQSLEELLEHPSLQDFDGTSFDQQLQAVSDGIASVGQRLALEEWKGDAIDSLALPEVSDRLERMTAPSLTDRHGEWAEYLHSRDSLLKFSVNELLRLIEQGKIEVDAAADQLAQVVYEARWEYALRKRPQLAELRSLDRHQLVQTFIECESDRVAEVQDLIRNTHLEQVPQGSAGQMSRIRSEIGKKRRHRSIRSMMDHAAQMIQKIKPIFLMSPISVAQFLKPGNVEFDLLVIDEASQVRPEDAIGSIARVKQIVVVGDQQQLPPTSFFDRLSEDRDGDEDETEDGSEYQAVKATEFESVLSLCEARAFGQRMLQWHYRSRDPSLITVSNAEFYGNRLILPPSPTLLDDQYGLKFVRVPGVYSSRASGKGRAGTNRIEAERMVARLQEIARDRPSMSVGIVTFSKSQADMVTEVLEFERRQDPALEEFLQDDTKNEGVFVKNIENVQGDERDIILISVGYGPHEANGRLASMRFGPVNSEGGERRLNVLFTRSRFACEVFASFDPADIKTSETSRRGLGVLKRFLEFAKTGVIPETYVSQGGADSPFEEDVAAEVRKLGYSIDHQVGTKGFRIDLGVRSPHNSEHFILAIECDGATYHSALWARERDRLRQAVLEGQGWRFHRIWSTDWFYRRGQEIARLKTALKDAEDVSAAPSMNGANEEPVLPEQSQRHRSDADHVVLTKEAIGVPPYTRANIAADHLFEPHDRPLGEVCQMVFEVVLVEGPVHVTEVARRYAEAHGKSSGARIRRTVVEGLAELKAGGQLTSHGDFWGTDEQFQAPPVRNRADESSATKKAEHISPHEIMACAALVIEQSGKMDQPDLTKEIGRMFGFKRTGSDFRLILIQAQKHKLI